MPADEHRSEDAPEFRSPKRALALSFMLSRDRWKATATRRLQEIKVFRVRVRDLQTSRDLWKGKALHLQRQIEDLKGCVSAGRQTDQHLATIDTAAPPADPELKAEPPLAAADQPPASAPRDAALLSVSENASDKKKWQAEE